MGLRYTHQAITTEQQIDILKERGLLIDDVKQAVKVLDTISYFRLAGYWRHFEADQTTHQFKKVVVLLILYPYILLINSLERYCLPPSKRLRFPSVQK